MIKKKPVDITKKQLVRRSAVLIGPAYQLLSSESEKAAILDMVVGRALLALIRLPLVPFASGKEGQYDQDTRKRRSYLLPHQTHPLGFMNSTIALWVNEEKSMGPTINSREWNMFRNPLGNCFRIATFAYDCAMVRHAVISFQNASISCV
jgi:hypothetical protein